MATHSKSFIHQTSVQKNLYENKRLTNSIPKHIMRINDANKDKVITTMKLTYFIAKKDIAIATYKDLCQL